jgi:hypothetical protein
MNQNSLEIQHIYLDVLSSVFDFSKEKIHILGIHLDISVH